MIQTILQISSITADNVDTYKNAVTKLTDCMDANIKVMYTIMAKTEEISNKFKNTENLAVRMLVCTVDIQVKRLKINFLSIFFCRREIRRLVDALDSVV